MKARWQRDQLLAAFREGGLEGQSPLIVHSSLYSLGWVEGGAGAVVEALLEVLGADGTLLTPTFNYFLEEGQVFDPRTVVCQTGAIPEALRKRPDALRSLHPTYSVAAVGRLARELTAEHWKAEPVGIDSPIDRLAQAGGWVLLLGVKHDSNSAIHVGEAYAGVPYRGVPFNPAWPRRAAVPLPSGQVVSLDLTLEPGCSTAFGVVELPLREGKCVRDFKVGQAKCQLVRARDVIDTTVALLRRRSDILLCSNLRCQFCPPAQWALRRAGA